MKNLSETRNNINTIDKKIATLFEERMLLVEEVINYKIENNIEILDNGREKEVISKNLENIKNEKYQKYYIEFITSMMDISKKYQREILEKRKK